MTDYDSSDLYSGALTSYGGSALAPPPAPGESVVEIRIAGDDMTAYILFDEAVFESAVNGQVGMCKFRVRDDARSLSFVTGSIIELFINGDVVWTGYLMKSTRGYVFPALNIDEFGLSRFFTIEGADINILLQKRFVYKKSDPTETLAPLYPAYTSDSIAIADLVSDWLDLSDDDLDTSSMVQTVADINEDQEARAWSPGMTWAAAMSSISTLPASVYFIDPSRRLVNTDVNTPDSRYGLSDQPTINDASYREMKVVRDGSVLANDVLAWGVGYGSALPVFHRQTNSTSISNHGLWQTGVFRGGVWKQATINRVAASIVNGSPSSHRGHKDDFDTVSVVTYQSGFVPAQKVPFRSNTFGFSDVIPIRRQRITFDSPTTPRYELTLSHAVDEPWGFLDPFIFDFRWPRFRIPRIRWVSPPWVFPGTCLPVPIDDFERTSGPLSFGVASIGQPWGTPNVNTNNDPGTDIVVDVTGGFGRIYPTVYAVTPSPSFPSGLVRAAVPLAVAFNPDEFIVSVTAHLVPNFPVMTSPTATTQQQASLSWRLDVGDGAWDWSNELAGDYLAMLLVVALEKFRGYGQSDPGSGTITVSFLDTTETPFSNFHTIFTQAGILTVAPFTATIDRSVSRGTTIVTLNSGPGGLFDNFTYTLPNSAADPLTGPLNIWMMGSGYAGNIPADYTPEITVDNLIACGAGVAPPCWFPISGYFDDFSRALDPTASGGHDTWYLPSEIGCTNGGYPWQNGVFNPGALVMVLDGGLHWGRSHASGFSFIAGSNYDLYLPFDAGKHVRVEFTLEMAMPTFYELHNASSQNQVLFSFGLETHEGPFAPVTSDGPDVYSVNFEVHAFSGYVNFPAPPHDLGILLNAAAYNNATSASDESPSDYQLTTAQNGFSGGVGVVLEVVNGVATLIIGGHTEVLSVPYDADSDITAAGNVYTVLNVSGDLLNYGSDAWGQPEDSDADFKCRISSFRVSSDAGTCVPVPPRQTAYPDNNGNC